MKKRKDAMLSFRVTEDEYQQLKALATKERRTLKQLFFIALDKTFRDWDKKESK